MIQFNFQQTTFFFSFVSVVLLFVCFILHKYVVTNEYGRKIKDPYFSDVREGQTLIGSWSMTWNWI